MSALSWSWDQPVTADRDKQMKWQTPRFEEICIGLEINGYFAAVL